MGLNFFNFFFLSKTENGLTNGKSFMFVCLRMGLNGFELSGWHCVIGYFFLNLPLLDRLFAVVAIIVVVVVVVCFFDYISEGFG